MDYNDRERIKENDGNRHKGGGKDKGWVLVTGAYGGMGRRTTSLLRGQGYKVLALDLKVPDRSDDNSDYRSDDAGVVPIEVDVSDVGSVSSAFETAGRHTQSICAIVHFAGRYAMDSLVEMTMEEFEDSFRTNVFGAFLVNRTFLPMLGAGGRIIMTTSELAPLDPLPFTGIYAVTKSTLDKYAYSLAMELQLLGVKVSVIRAGAVSTNMLGASTSALDRFCSNTRLYTCNADRFKHVVDSIEAKSVPPERIASKVLRILGKRSPAFAYSVNRNPLLLLLNALPKRLQLFAIRQILKT